MVCTLPHLYIFNFKTNFYLYLSDEFEVMLLTPRITTKEKFQVKGFGNKRSFSIIGEFPQSIDKWIVDYFPTGKFQVNIFFPSK